MTLTLFEISIYVLPIVCRSAVSSTTVACDHVGRYQINDEMISGHAFLMWVDSESVVQYFSVPFGHGIIFAMFVATEKSARDANDFGGHRGEGKLIRGWG